MIKQVEANNDFVVRQQEPAGQPANEHPECPSTYPVAASATVRVQAISNHGRKPLWQAIQNVSSKGWLQQLQAERIQRDIGKRGHHMRAVDSPTHDTHEGPAGCARSLRTFSGRAILKKFTPRACGVFGV